MLHINFQMLSDDGLLFYAASQLNEEASDFLLLTISEGYIELFYNLGGGRFSTAALRSKNKIMKNQWHEIYINQTGKHATLSVNGKVTTQETPSGLITLDTNTEFYLGK